ncbi:MAG: tetratricopeptide repeat protein [Dysgonomonas sp.]|nr:tetratricopeptide repeat protein [Dysgonomonas sp.]
MTHETLLKKLEQLHVDGKHEKIVELLLAIPQNERDYNLTGLLARALNNINRYEEALHLLETIRDQGKEDYCWHFRMGYSLYYIDGRETEAIPYLERAIELGDDYPSTYELLHDARSYLDDEESSDSEVDDMSFTPKGFAVLSLNMRLQPKHRGTIEDGLDFMLRSKGLGCISGGGTLTSSEGEPESCDIDIDLVEDSEEVRQQLRSIAEKIEVAKGSILRYRSIGENKESSGYDIEYPAGQMEGLAVYINGTDLPDEVYENYDIKEVLDKLLNILRSNGAFIYSYWNGPKEVALYFYGEGGYDMMLEKVTPFLKEHPLCQQCRTVRIA